MDNAMLSAAEKGAGLRRHGIEGAASDSVRLFELKKVPEPKRQPWILQLSKHSQGPHTPAA